MTTDFDLITVTPWRSGGRHRLYVSDRRQSLGFLDESTGTLVLADARYQPVVEQALRTAGYPHTSLRGEDTLAHDPEPREDHTRWGEERAADRHPESTARPQHARVHAAAPVRGEVLGSDEHDEEHLAATSDVPPEPTTDADPDPERVWACLAAGRAPRTTSVPHGWRTPSTSLTALLRGEPSLDAARHGKVGAEIATLVDTDPEWQALELDSTEIDHLLIGPGGAFALSTKVHPGSTVQVTCQSVVVDDAAQPWVQVGLHAGRRAQRALSQACHQAVTVTALLVIDAERLTTTLPPPVGVVALGLQDLCRWLQAQPEILTPGTIAMLADAARQSTSWYRR